jgi:hypothetical protein
VDAEWMPSGCRVDAELIYSVTQRLIRLPIGGTFLEHSFIKLNHLKLWFNLASNGRPEMSYKMGTWPTKKETIFVSYYGIK